MEKKNSQQTVTSLSTDEDATLKCNIPHTSYVWEKFNNNATHISIFNPLGLILWYHIRSL